MRHLKALTLFDVHVIIRTPTHGEAIEGACRVGIEKSEPELEKIVEECYQRTYGPESKVIVRKVEQVMTTENGTKEPRVFVIREKGESK